MNRDKVKRKLSKLISKIEQLKSDYNLKEMQKSDESVPSSYSLTVLSNSLVLYYAKCKVDKLEKKRDKYEAILT